MGPPRLKMIRNLAFEFPHKPSPSDSDCSACFHKLSQVTQVQVVRAVVEKGINTHDRVEKLGGEWQRSRVGMNWEDAVVNIRIPDSLYVLRALNQRSVAQTSTPNSRRRKIDDDARPQPRSRTRMPGRRSIAVVSHSVSQSEFAPPLTLVATHSG